MLRLQGLQVAHAESGSPNAALIEPGSLGLSVHSLRGVLGDHSGEHSEHLGYTMLSF